MVRPDTLLLLAIGLLLASTAPAQQSDESAILDVMQRAFDAVRSQDPDDWRAIQLADGTTLSVRKDANSADEMRISRNEDFIAGSGPDGRDYLEQWTAEPTVLIRGPIAVVWGEYDFWIDGKFSHCGVDAVDLVKVDGEWKIANFTWTVEREDCPTDPAN